MISVKSPAIVWLLKSPGLTTLSVGSTINIELITWQFPCKYLKQLLTNQTRILLRCFVIISDLASAQKLSNKQWICIMKSSIRWRLYKSLCYDDITSEWNQNIHMICFALRHTIGVRGEKMIVVARSNAGKWVTNEEWIYSFIASSSTFDSTRFVFNLVPSFGSHTRRIYVASLSHLQFSCENKLERLTPQKRKAKKFFGRVEWISAVD